MLVFRVAAAVSLPVVFALLGLKSLFGFIRAYRGGRFQEVFHQKATFYVVVGLANGLFAGLFLYGWLIESQWVEVVHEVVRISGRQKPSLRIVHLSDLHIQDFGERERVTLDYVRSANPDLICLTGDYLRSGTGDASVSSAQRFLRELDAPLGVYAVTGNWDFDPRTLFLDSNIELLSDSCVDIDIGSGRLRLSGVRFSSSPSVLEGPPNDVLSILLHHNPDYLEVASDLGYDLYLAGHTHGGQVRIPGLGAIVRMSVRGYDAGLYSMENTWLYVNRGLGAEKGPLPEFRLFCRPEVTVIDVKEAGE